MLFSAVKVALKALFNVLYGLINILVTQSQNAHRHMQNLMLVTDNNDLDNLISPN